MISDMNDSLRVLESLFTHNPDAVYAFDLSGRFVKGNAVCAVISGYDLSELNGRSFRDLVVESESLTIESKFDEIKAGHSVTHETTIRHKDGHMVHLIVTTMPMKARGRVVGACGVAKDISAGKSYQKLLSGQQRILEMIAQGERTSSILEEIVNVMGSLYSDSKAVIWTVHPSTGDLVLRAGKQVPKKTRNCVQKEILHRDREGDEEVNSSVEVDLSNGLKTSWTRPFFDLHGAMYGCVSLHFDNPTMLAVHEVKFLDAIVHLIELAFRNQHQKREMMQLAFQDPLTECANRRRFYDVLSKTIRQDSSVAVMFLDMDRFKRFNDTLGHEFGDKLLRIVAERIRKCLPEHAMLARMGGDEFTVLMESCDSEDEAVQIASRVLEETSLPVSIDGYPVEITVSIGIVLAPRDGHDINTIMKNVDTAMYVAKGRGRSRYAVYSPEMNDKYMERLSLELELRDALRQEEFQIHYQPKLCLKTSRIVGAEALIRWNHPKYGLLLPGRFIPIAEETDLIHEIGNWVFRDVCTTVKRWQDSGLPEIRVAVNVSGRGIVHPEFVSRVFNVIDETGVDPTWIELEITESMLITDGDIVKNAISHLKRRGLRLALDDFGTGYSSLSVLTQFDIDTLKIDQSFTSGILTKTSKFESVIMAIIDLAHSMDMRVVAEGVETEQQMIFLRQQECDVMQGFFFSAAVAPTVLESMILEGHLG